MSEELKRIKKLVDGAREYFKSNIEIFNANKRFLFISTISGEEQNILERLGKPAFDFNTLEAYVSRLRGEFGIQNPTIQVQSAYQNADDRTMAVTDLLENIIRCIFYESNADNNDDKILKDTMGGGFSVLKIGTEYRSDNSLKQKICLKYPFDVTLCGFDPLARKPHKGDGDFCYELIPIKEDDFKKQYPNANINDDFVVDDYNNWYFKSDKQEKVILVCEFYEKKYKKIKQVLDKNGLVHEKGDYLKLKQEADEQGLEIAPIEDEKERTILDKITRTTLMSTTILETKDTDFKNLPLVFFDGDSVFIDKKQIIRSYFKNAKDSQRAKNITASVFLDYIQNIRTTTLKIPERGLPTGDVFLEAYTNPQVRKAAYVYKDLDEKGQIQAPSEVVQSPLPPEVIQGFQMFDGLIQAQLGAFDASLGISGNDISGAAIIEGSNNSNAAAKPRIINFIASMNQVAKIIIDLIPKFYNTPMTIPIIDNSGKRYYQKINYPGDNDSVQLEYSPNDLDVYVEEGVSFNTQKQQSLKTMVQLAQAVPGFNNLLSNTGLPIVISNLDIKDGDKLKKLSEDQLQQQQQQQAMQAQQPPQPNPMQIKMMQIQSDTAMKQKQLALDAAELDLKHRELMGKMEMMRQDTFTDLKKAESENNRSQATLDIKNAELQMKRIDQVIAAMRLDHDRNMDLLNHFKSGNNQ